MSLSTLAMEFCKECGQKLPKRAAKNCSTHEKDVGSAQAEITDSKDAVEEQSIEFRTFESPLQEIKEENGFLTITTDSEQRTKISCSLVRQRVDDVIDVSKYDVYADTDNCKIILTGNEDDMPTLFIAFKTRKAFERCYTVLRPFRPHLNSSVQHNRPSPSTNPRRVREMSTVTPKTLRKLTSDQFQPELVTVNEVEISYITKWKDEQALKRASDEGSQSSLRSDQFHGRSDGERSSSGSELDMVVDPTILHGGRHAKEKRYKKTVKLTSDQFNALQIKKLSNFDKPIITRGGTFNHMTLLEGDELIKVNGQRSQTIHPESYSLEGNSSSETVSITVRSCPGSICASNVPNNVIGLGITWNDTVVEGVSAGLLSQDSVFEPLRHEQGAFCLTHVDGKFIPFLTKREKIYQLLQKAGERVDLIFQPTERMRAVAER